MTVLKYAFLPEQENCNLMRSDDLRSFQPLGEKTINFENSPNFGQSNLHMLRLSYYWWALSFQSLLILLLKPQDVRSSGSFLLSHRCPWESKWCDLCRDVIRQMLWLASIRAVTCKLHNIGIVGWCHDACLIIWMLLWFLTDAYGSNINTWSISLC